MITSHGIVAVIKKDDKYLLVKEARDDLNGHWAPPHGRCNNEDKTEEETVTATVSFWLAEVEEGKIKIDSSEISEYGWFSLEETLELLLFPGTKKFFEKVKNKEIIF